MSTERKRKFRVGHRVIVYGSVARLSDINEHGYALGTVVDPPEGTWMAPDVYWVDMDSGRSIPVAWYELEQSR